MRRYSSSLVDCANPVVRNHPLNIGLVAWYLCVPGLQGGAKWHDLMSLPSDFSTGNYGTLTNGPKWQGTSRPGGFGHLLFDGVDDVVNVPNLSWPSGQPITIAFWVNNQEASDHAAFSLGNQNDPNRCSAHVPYSDNVLYWDFGFQAGGGRITANFSSYTKKWTHVCLLAGGGRQAIFLDGRLVTNQTSNNTPATLTGLTIGRFTYSPLLFLGPLDDFRLYQRTLSDREVHQLTITSALGYPGLLRRTSIKAGYSVTPQSFIFNIKRTGQIDCANPVNRSHPLVVGRIAWWMCVPGLSGGAKWHDLMSLPGDFSRGNHGTLNNFTSSSGWSSSTRPGGFGSLSADGSDDAVKATLSSGIGLPVTLAAWVKTSSSNNQTFVSLGTPGPVWLGIGSTGMKPYVYVSEASNNITTTSANTMSTGWNRIVGTFTATDRRLYVNGVQLVSDTTSRNPVGLNQLAAVAFWASGGTSSFLNGIIDDVAVVKRIWSDLDVVMDYNVSRQGYQDILHYANNRRIILPGVAILNINVSSILFGL